MKKGLFILVAAAAACLAAAAAQAVGVDVTALLAKPENAIALAGLGAMGTIKFVSLGKVMDWVNGTGGAVASGKMVVVGIKVGIALGAIANGATGSVQVAGNFVYAKLGTDVVAQGVALYYDAGNDRLTTTAAGNTLAGYAFNAAGNGVATCQILLNGCPA